MYDASSCIMRMCGASGTMAGSVNCRSRRLLSFLWLSRWFSCRKSCTILSSRRQVLAAGYCTANEWTLPSCPRIFMRRCEKPKPRTRSRLGRKRSMRMKSWFLSFSCRYWPRHLDVVEFLIAELLSMRRARLQGNRCRPPIQLLLELVAPLSELLDVLVHGRLDLHEVCLKRRPNMAG